MELAGYESLYVFQDIWSPSEYKSTTKLRTHLLGFYSLARYLHISRTPHIYIYIYIYEKDDTDRTLYIIIIIMSH